MFSCHRLHSIYRALSESLRSIIPILLSCIDPIPPLDFISQRKYVERGLRVLAEMEQRLKFHNRMKMDVIKDDDINQVFLSIEGVYRFNSQLLDTLMRLRFEGMDVFLTRLGETVDRVMGFLKMYVEYVLKTKTAIARLRQLEKENTKFRDFLIINEAVAGVNLITLLQAPVRIITAANIIITAAITAIILLSH